MARTWQHRLDQRLATNMQRDQQWAQLAGNDVTRLARSAAAKGPLPGGHPAAALWRRILDELPQPLPDSSKSNRHRVRTDPQSGGGKEQYEVGRSRTTDCLVELSHWWRC
jgi:hypothetical protein